MDVSLETRMSIPAYFHTLNEDQLSLVMDRARETIFSDDADMNEKKMAGVRLHYASMARDGVSLMYQTHQ